MQRFKTMNYQAHKIISHKDYTYRSYLWKPIKYKVGKCSNIKKKTTNHIQFDTTFYSKLCVQTYSLGKTFVFFHYEYLKQGRENLVTHAFSRVEEVEC